MINIKVLMLAYDECDAVRGSSEYTNQLTPVGGGLNDRKLTN